MTRRVPEINRYRTCAGDLDFLARVAAGGGHVELSHEQNRRYSVTIVPANGSAYSAQGPTVRDAVRNLRDDLEELAAEASDSLSFRDYE